MLCGRRPPPPDAWNSPTGTQPSSRYTAHQILSHPWLVESKDNSEAPISTQRLQGFKVLALIQRGMPALLAKAESDLYDLLDKDNDGFISKEELSSALELIGISVHADELDSFLRMADTNNDGKVSREEFEAVLSAQFQNASAARTCSSLEVLEVLFASFDRDNDGYIAVDDVDHVLSLLGSSSARSAGRLELEDADLDGDGRVSFAEFVRFVRLVEEEKMERGTGGLTSSVMLPRGKRDMLRSRR